MRFVDNLVENYCVIPEACDYVEPLTRGVAVRIRRSRRSVVRFPSSPRCCLPPSHAGTAGWARPCLYQHRLTRKDWRPPRLAATHAMGGLKLQHENPPPLSCSGSACGAFRGKISSLRPATRSSWRKRAPSWLSPRNRAGFISMVKLTAPEENRTSTGAGHMSSPVGTSSR